MRFGGSSKEQRAQAWTILLHYRPRDINNAGEMCQWLDVVRLCSNSDVPIYQVITAIRDFRYSIGRDESSSSEEDTASSHSTTDDGEGYYSDSVSEQTDDIPPPRRGRKGAGSGESPTPNSDGDVEDSSDTSQEGE